MGQLAARTATTQIVAQPTDRKNTLISIIENNWSRMAAVMPKHMSPERMLQLSISTINQTPKLAECSPQSILSCLMTCSTLGVEPSSVDGLGRAYIIPYKNGKSREMQATFILGYKGMIDLARRSKEIKSIEAHAVYEGDEFDYCFGLQSNLVHRPKNASNKLTHVYMVAHFVNGGYHMEVMTKAEVDKVKERSMSARSTSSPWNTDYEAMALKSVIRKSFKFLPVSSEAMRAVESDDNEQSVYLDVFKPQIIASGVSEPQGAICEAETTQQAEEETPDYRELAVPQADQA